LIEQNVFTCGISHQLFKEKYDYLSESDKNRLVRVSERVWLTIKLRYEQTFIHNPLALKYKEFNLQFEELPSIEVYLLCTCLDTLAGQGEYTSFDEWLENQNIKEGLAITDVISLYNQYADECGIGKNLHRLFTNLPECFKNWLASNVKLVQEGKPLLDNEIDKAQLVDNLYKFFYEYLRNAYTHSGVSRRIKIADDIFEPIDDGAWVTPVEGTLFPLIRKRRNQLWNFSYREGLDLATLLRLIIYAAVVRFIDFELNNDLISKNIRMYSRLNSFYAFINEVSANSNWLNYLENLDERQIFGSDLMFIEFPLLWSNASKRLVGRYNKESPLDLSYVEFTNQYITYVNGLNTEINIFNEINPRSTRASENKILYQRKLIDFIRNLKNLSTYKIIKDLPMKNEIINFWRLINNPCES
jgi:hypothetical protein